MSLVEIVGKDGKVLGVIDEINNRVEITEEWEKITAKKKKQDEKDKEFGILRRVREGIEEISVDGGITWAGKKVEE